ncbi:MAG: hypothetical protein KY460_12705 [Actinobacteria bacterium]|nr:hypothetical protein [Actinomycetota bacterium]
MFGGIDVGVLVVAAVVVVFVAHVALQYRAIRQRRLGRSSTRQDRSMRARLEAGGPELRDDPGDDQPTWR